MVSPNQTTLAPLVVRPPIPEVSKSAEWIQLSSAAAFQLGRRQTSRDIVSSLPLVLFDILTVALAIAISTLVGNVVGSTSSLGRPLFVAMAMVLTIIFQQLHGLYPACGIPYSIEYRRLLRTSLSVVICLGCGLLMRQTPSVSLAVEFFVFSMCYAVALPLTRSMARYGLCRYDWWAQPVAVLGDPRQARELHRQLERFRSEGLRPLGIVFDPERYWEDAEAISSNLYIGPVTDLESILLRTGTCRVAVADSELSHKQQYHHFQGIPHVMLPTDLGYQPSEGVRLSEHDGRIAIHCHSSLTEIGSLFAKRLMDLAVVILSAPLWIPVMFAIGVCIKCTSKGPVFYRQVRVGRFGRPFKALKFRSMVCDAERRLRDYLSQHPELEAEWQTTHKLKNDPRVTTFGNFLRKSSLDELPQILNVLCGEMSLVGPRPIVDCSSYDREYIEEHPEVFELYQMVRPGITGLWQISGRNSLPYRQRIYLDRFYLLNWTITLDIYILWRTVKTALFREGAF